MGRASGSLPRRGETCSSRRDLRLLERHLSPDAAADQCERRHAVITIRKGRGRLPATPNQQPVSTRHPRGRHRRITCRCHCRDCGRHFASLDAFDAHRHGRFATRQQGLDGRHCVGPENNDRFEPVLGTCAVAGPQPSGGAIWRLTAAAQRVRGQFAPPAPERVPLGRAA